jgi:hypothetical protein
MGTPFSGSQILNLAKEFEVKRIEIKRNNPGNLAYPVLLITTSLVEV